MITEKVVDKALSTMITCFIIGAVISFFTLEGLGERAFFVFIGGITFAIFVACMIIIVLLSTKQSKPPSN